MIFSKRNLFFCLAFSLFIMPLFGRGVFAAANEERIAEIQKQIEELERQAEQYRNQIKQNQGQAATLQRDINTLNSQISKLEVQLRLTEAQIQGATIKIGDLEGQINETKLNINKNQNTIGQLVTSINEHDSENLLFVLVKNNAISEFFNQVQYNSNLQKEMIAALLALKETKGKFEEQKNQLEGKKQELEALEQAQVDKKLSLGGTKQDKNQLLQVTKGKESQYQSLLSEVEKRKAAFFEELQKLEKDTLQKGAFILHVSAKIPPKAKIFREPENDPVLTQGYGMTAYARRGAYGGAPHNGIDLASGFGTPIRPIGNGRVLVSGNNNGWGNWVAVQHDNGLVSVYAHMKGQTIQGNGRPVTTSSILGYEGSTGNSTGSHVHVSLYYDFFTFINPRNGQIYFNYFEGSLNPLDYIQR